MIVDQIQFSIIIIGFRGSKKYHVPTIKFFNGLLLAILNYALLWPNTRMELGL